MCIKHYHGHSKHHSSVQISDNKGTPVCFNDAVMNHCAHSFGCMKDIQKERGKNTEKIGSVKRT